MMTQRIASLFLPAFLGLVAWSTLSAQSEWLPEEATPIQRQFVDEAGTRLTEYWNPRLNEYKQTIDRMLAPNDLEKLNRMRVRWSILMNKLAQQMRQVKELEEGEETEFDFEVGEGEEFVEIMAIWTGTMDLAGGYRSGLDNLGDNVIEDVGGFTSGMADFVEEFARANQGELQGDEKGQELLANRNEIVLVAVDQQRGRIVRGHEADGRDLLGLLLREVERRKALVLRFDP